MVGVFLESLSDTLALRVFEIAKRKQELKERVKHESEDQMVLEVMMEKVEVVMRERKVEQWEYRMEIELGNEESVQERTVSDQNFQKTPASFLESGQLEKAVSFEIQIVPSLQIVGNDLSSVDLFIRINHSSISYLSMEQLLARLPAVMFDLVVRNTHPIQLA